MRRLLAGLALVVGAFASATSASAATTPPPEPPPPGLGIRLVDAPVATADDPRARVYIVDHVAPGSTLQRRIEVTNGTDSDSVVSLYAGAAKITDAAFTGETQESENELTQWVSVTPKDTVLQPGERLEGAVTITVPVGATEGEHYGVIWAQTAATPDGGGVTQVTRVGIRIYLSVGPGGVAPSDFTITELSASRTADGAPVVHATVHNTGERALDLSAQLTLTDGPGGLSAGPFATDPVTTLGIGGSAPITIELDPQLPDGPWHARLTVTSGLEDRTADATITFPEPGHTAQAEIAPGVPRAMIVTALAAVLLIVVALAIRQAASRRRPAPRIARVAHRREHLHRA